MSDEREGERRRAPTPGMLGRRQGDNHDSHMLWVKTEYIDPSIEAALQKAEQIWRRLVRDEIAEHVAKRNESDLKNDDARDWRTVRIASGISLLVSGLAWVSMKLKGWL